DRLREDARAWKEEQAKKQRVAALHDLMRLRDAGHEMLNFLQRPGRQTQSFTAQQAVQWYRNEVVELADRIVPGKGATLDSPFLMHADGREIRNPNPGIAPTHLRDLVPYLSSLLRRLEGFLEQA